MSGEVNQLLDDLRKKNVRLWVEGGRLRYNAPHGAITEAIVSALRFHRETVLERLAVAGDSCSAHLQTTERHNPRRLSFAQERMWFLWKLAPESPAYNVPFFIKLTGRLSVDALLDSLHCITLRHDILRTRIIGGPDGVRQLVEKDSQLDVQIIKLAGDHLTEREESARRHIVEEATTPFDLEQTIPFAVRVYQLEETSHWVFVKLHHLVADAWSITLFLRELAAFYVASERCTAASLPPVSFQYSDFAAWQRDRLQDGYRERLLSYWKKKLTVDLPSLRLPADGPHALTERVSGGRVTFQLAPGTAQRLGEVARGLHATMFMALLSLVRILLFRYTEQSDVQIGVPVICRNHPDVEGMIGYFGNTLVLRNSLDPAGTYADVLLHERDNALEAYDHQELPFEVLVQELVPARAFDRNPLFHVMFSFTDTEPIVEWPPGLKVEVAEVETETAKFDLLLSLHEAEGTLDGVIEYSSDVFSCAAAERMVGHLQVLADDMGRRPRGYICGTSLLTAQERDTMLCRWNETTYPRSDVRCLHELFEDQVAAAPHAIAVYWHQDEVTYANLNRDANRIAHRLVEHGVQPGDLIAVCVRRSPALVAALLGILKAGAAYIPIDPLYPVHRIEVILAESRSPLLVTERTLAGGLTALKIPRFELDAEPAATSDEEENLARPSSPGDVAYVLYTSGSSGPPKGVVIEHRNTAALLAWAYSIYDKEDLACVLAATSVCFDLSVFELFVPLCSGHSIALAENVFEFPSLATRNRVTLINTVPSLMRVLLSEHSDRFHESLRVVNLAGEPLETSLVDLIYRRTRATRVYDLYGPTEATTYSTFKLRLPEQPPSIGRPISNTRCYVLDPHGSPVPVGVVGELCLAGEGLARGYLHRPDLTGERFTMPRSPLIAEDLLYHTGDLVRYTPTGDLEYVGRNDNLLKIRGYRIEPEEVRTALRAIEGVEDAIVVGHRNREGESMLAAYVVSDPARFDAKLLKHHLQRVLPAHAIPSTFVPITALPLSPNGKVDISHLPDPHAVDRSRRRSVAEPETETQRLVVKTWTELLGLDAIGVDDDFFDLGGHSLTAMRATAWINDALGIDLPLRVIFDHSTVDRFSVEIDFYRAGIRVPDVPPLRPQRRDRAPATLLQRHLWRLHHAVQDSSFLNITSCTSLLGELDLSAARHSLLALVERHSILRTKFIVIGDLWQVPAIDVPLEITFEDLHSPGEEQAAHPTIEAVYEKLMLPFDIGSGPCARFAIVRRHPNHHELVMVLHHIIVDEWSLGLLRREFAASYSAKLNGLPFSMPPVPATFADHAAWEQECLATGVFAAQMAQWREVLKPPLPLLRLPWRNGNTYGRESIRSYPIAIDSQLVARLAEAARHASSSLFVVLLSALKRLLQHLTGATDIRVAANLAARHRRGFQNVIGPITDTVILRTYLPVDHTPSSALQLVRATFVSACGLQGLPFDEIAARLESESNISRDELAQVFFHFDEGDATTLPPLPGLTVEEASEEQDGRFFEIGLHSYDLILYLRRTERGILGQLAIRGHLDDGATATDLIAVYMRLLEELA